MTRIESTLSVPRPLEEVFAFLNAPESHARFIPNMAEFQPTSPGAFGKIGARAQGRLHYLGLLKVKVNYEITEHVLNHRLAMKGKMGPILFRDGYILQKNRHGTEIQFWLELMPAGWAKLLSPFMGLIGKIHAWETLRNLKRELLKGEVASSLHFSK
ncbi:MAG TPA: SRPBCC family protein [Anaerolineales bacterium]|nr:SRPBCC family protein [Anaerolineales bacterium]